MCIRDSRRARRPGSSCRARGACGSLRPGRTRGPRSACCPRRTAGSGGARRTGKPGLSRRPRGAGKSVSARGSRGSRKSGFSRGTCRAGRTRRPGCARRTCGAGKSGSSCGAGRPGDRTDLLTWYAAARNTPLAMTIHRNDPLPFKCFPAHAMCPEIHAFRLCPLREGINARSGRGLPSSWTRTGFLSSKAKALRPAVGSAEVESYGSSRAGPVYLTAGPECAIIVSRIRHSGGVAPFRARSRP